MDVGDVTPVSFSERRAKIPEGAVNGTITLVVKNESGTSEKFEVTSQATTLDLRAIEDRALRMYPNPSSNEVQFEGLSAIRRYSYEVYSLLGRKLLSGTFQGDEAIDLSALSPAQYIISLESKEKALLHRQLLILR